jgi:hypothetical protein
VVDRDRPPEVGVIWTEDGMKAALLTLTPNVHRM